ATERRKRVDGVPGHEERRRDALTLQQRENPRHPDPRAELATRKRRRRRLATRLQPDRHRVEVERQTRCRPLVHEGTTGSDLMRGVNRRRSVRGRLGGEPPTRRGAAYERTTLRIWPNEEPKPEFDT